MINYSITMRGVNSNLFEINQAKARVKAAQAAGQTPNSDDLALVATQQQQAFALAQYSDVMTIDKFARHIADHGCVYKRTDIAAILNMAVDCLREQLLDGKKVRLGDLGDFSVKLKSNGAPTAEKFSAQNITNVEVVWDRGKEFKNLIHDAEFNPVVSRSAQAAVLKAVKAGQTSVDLTEQSTNNPGNSQNNGQTNGTTVNHTLTLSAQPANGGTVSGDGSYANGATATLRATANSGYTFNRWSDGNTQNPRTLQVTEDKTLQAEFSATSGNGGSTGGDSGVIQG